MFQGSTKGFWPQAGRGHLSIARRESTVAVSDAGRPDGVNCTPTEARHLLGMWAEDRGGRTRNLGL